MSSNSTDIVADTGSGADKEQIDELRSKLKEANSRIAELSSEVQDLKIDGKHKDDRIKSLMKVNLSLRRQVPGKFQVSRILLL